MSEVSKINIKDLVSWIKFHAENRNKSSILIEIDNSIGCIVNVLLAKQTGLLVHAVIDSITDTDIACKLSNILNIDKIIFDKFEIADEIYEGYNNKFKLDLNNPSRLELVKHYKILDAAEVANSLILSNITRNDYLFVRNYPKFHSWDIMPLADLSEVAIEYLVSILLSSHSININFIKNLSSKINLNMEWLYSANKKTGIIESNQDPTKHPNWYTFTIEQKQLIAKVHQTEKLTKYKENKNIPIFKFDD